MGPGWCSQWLEHGLVHRRVSGLIPRQGRAPGFRCDPQPQLEHMRAAAALASLAGFHGAWVARETLS